jgi:hypothetical protein
LLKYKKKKYFEVNRQWNSLLVEAMFSKHFSWISPLPVLDFNMEKEELDGRGRDEREENDERIE